MEKEISVSSALPAAEYPMHEIESIPAYEALEAGIDNYTSLLAEKEEARIELQRLIGLGLAEVIEEAEVLTTYGDGTISRMAIIIKLRADQT